MVRLLDISVFFGMPMAVPRCLAALLMTWKIARTDADYFSFRFPAAGRKAKCDFFLVYAVIALIYLSYSVLCL